MRVLVTSRPLRTELEERVIQAALDISCIDSDWDRASIEMAYARLHRAVRMLRIERGEK